MIPYIRKNNFYNINIGVTWISPSAYVRVQALSRSKEVALIKPLHHTHNTDLVPFTLDVGGSQNLHSFS